MEGMLPSCAGVQIFIHNLKVELNFMSISVRIIRSSDDLVADVVVKRNAVNLLEPKDW